MSPRRGITHRALLAGATTGLVAMTLLVGPQAPAAPATDIDAPVLSNARIAPKVLPVPRKALLKVHSSEPAELTGYILIKQDGRWNRSTSEMSWRLDQGANRLTLFNASAQRLLVEGKYRLKIKAEDAAGNDSNKLVLNFKVDLRR